MTSDIQSAFQAFADGLKPAAENAGRKMRRFVEATTPKPAPEPTDHSPRSADSLPG